MVCVVVYDSIAKPAKYLAYLMNKGRKIWGRP
jgi:hypothetical protein